MLSGAEKKDLWSKLDTFNNEQNVHSVVEKTALASTFSLFHL